MGKLKSFWFLLLVGCGSTEPGNIEVAMEFDNTVDVATQNSIDQFVFLIRDINADQRLLFPPECLGCTTGDSSCASSDQCLELSDCGFSSGSAQFVPEVSFARIPQGSTLEMIACALDSGRNPVAAGLGTAKNQAGAETSITLSTTLTDCTNSLPPPCP